MNNVETQQFKQAQRDVAAARIRITALESEIASLRASLASAPAQAQGVGGENWSSLTLLEVGKILGNTGTLERLPELARNIMAELQRLRKK